MTPLFEIFIHSLVLCSIPGPINILSALFGKKKGLSNSLGFIAGASLGFSCLVITVGTGLVKAIDDYPQLINLLKYVGGLYIIFISVCMVFLDEEELTGCIKCKFFDGFFIQWINVKSWIWALFVASSFSNIRGPLIIFASIEFIVEFICLILWAYAGEQIAKIWSSPRQQKIFDTILAISLATIAILILAG
ncbi:MAG: LysE family translocator [Oligoflexales bacterium]